MSGFDQNPFLHLVLSSFIKINRTLPVTHDVDLQLHELLPVRR